MEESDRGSKSNEVKSENFLQLNKASSYKQKESSKSAKRKANKRDFTQKRYSASLGEVPLEIAFEKAPEMEHDKNSTSSIFKHPHKPNFDKIDLMESDSPHLKK